MHSGHSVASPLVAGKLAKQKGHTASLAVCEGGEDGGGDNDEDDEDDDDEDEPKNAGATVDDDDDDDDEDGANETASGDANETGSDEEAGETNEDDTGDEGASSMPPLATTFGGNPLKNPPSTSGCGQWIKLIVFKY